MTRSWKIGALSGFHPYIISVWGSDIFSFPHYSKLHLFLLKFNLSKADIILSTSKVLKKETEKFTGKSILITPFGIDTEKFLPKDVNSLFNKEDIVIGTIKTLEKNYGIEYLIKAFSLVKDKYPYKSLKGIV